MQKLADQHVDANRSALGHYDAFRGHRERLTSLVVSAAQGVERGSLCVLGAGNAFDLDLEQLADHYSDICLVDIDPVAVSGAVKRQPAAVQAALREVAPVDLSGLSDCMARWARLEVTPEELAEHAARTARDVHGRIGATFDVVVSACMLSQMQLDVVRGFGDKHPLFPVVSWTLSVAHLRTLTELTKPGGCAVFASDVTETTIYPLADQYTTSEGLALVNAATESGKIFDFADPRRLRGILEDDPVASRAFTAWQLADAWVWQNGPTARFLVYGAVLPRARS